MTHRIRIGRLHRVHRGVYAVGHAKLTFEGRCLAAAFSFGEGAVVSHQSAAAIWGMLRAHDGWIHITIPTRNGRGRRDGILIHRPPSFGAGFSADGTRLSTHRDGIPVTTPDRTLRDLRRTAPALVQPAFRRALDLMLVGADVLGPEPDLTRSKLERRLLALCRRHRLPVPEVNAVMDLKTAGAPRGLEVDFLWRGARLVVEADSYRFHAGRDAFERDRARDARLEAAGFRVVRVTHRQIAADPAAIASTLRALLSAGSG